MSIIDEINQVLAQNPICQRSVNEVRYFAPDGATWNMLVTTVRGRKNRFFTTPELPLEVGQEITLFVSIRSQPHNPLGIDRARLAIKPVDIGGYDLVMRATLDAVGGYGESLHGSWSLQAIRCGVLELSEVPH